MNLLPRITRATRILIAVLALVGLAVVVDEILSGYAETRSGSRIYRTKYPGDFVGLVIFHALVATFLLFLALFLPSKKKKISVSGEIALHRRKHAAHFVLVPIAFGIDGVLCYSLVIVACKLSSIFGGQFTTFTEYSHRAQTIIALAMMFAVIPIGFLSTNLLVWTIPPIRKWFDGEAKEREGASFSEASAELLKISKYWSLPMLGIGFGVALLWR
ncbi:MAG: hypothetical protein WCA95_15695 [Opitutaceae bacterium]